MVLPPVNLYRKLASSLPGAVVAAVLSLPAIAIGEVVAGPPSDSASQAAAPGLTQAPPLEIVVEQLRARLEGAPDDVDGWVLLARSYHFLGRYDAAEGALAKARELGYDGPALEAPRRSAIDPVIMNDIRSTVQHTQVDSSPERGTSR